MIRQDSDNIRETLARQGLRCTKQREEIYGALCASESHPTAEELFNLVRQSQAGISLATVYNTLDALTKRALCRRVAVGGAGAPGGGGGGGGACRYDADMTEHLHMVTPDGRVRDVPENLGAEVLNHIPDEAIRRIERAMGMKVSRVNIEFVAGADGGGGRGRGEGDEWNQGEEAI